MNRVFKGRKPFRVPDGTLVAPLLNPSDSLSGLPSEISVGFSLAAGRIEARHRSRIQFMPFTEMVTFVTRGRLLARMKGPHEKGWLSRAPVPTRAQRDAALARIRQVGRGAPGAAEP